MKKDYYGNYLGLVINNADPEYRGRVQVFIPHIMPALYEGWNKGGADIQISCVGSNIPEGLAPDIHARLIKILPWAEAASPIIGGSSPGNLTPAAIGGMIGGAIGGAVAGAPGQAIGQAAGQAIGGAFNQQPTVNPATIPGELGAIYNEAQNYLGSPEALKYQREYFQKYGKYDTEHSNYGLTGKGLTGYNGGGYNGACARGTVAALGAMTGNAAFKQGSAGGNANDYSLSKSAPNDVFAQSGLYQPKQAIPANYVPQVGDVIACAGGSGFGHIQTYTGVGSKPWTSDTPQDKACNNDPRYNNCALHRATPEAQNTIKAKLDSLYGKGASGALGGGTPGESTAESAAPAAVPPTLAPDAQVPTTAPTPPANSGMTAGGPGTGTPAGTISGGGTVSDGIAKLAADRQAKFANELNDPAIQKQLGYLASREVDNSGDNENVRAGSNATNQQQFIETAINRAMFSNRSISSVISDMEYWIPPEQRRTEPDYRLRTDYQNFTPTTAYNTALNKVLQGGNLTNLATDNASNVGTNTVADRRIADGVTGVWLKDGKVVGRNEGELYYRGDGKNKYFSTAGRNATKYANENGINQSSAVASSESIVAAAASSAPSVVNNTDPGGLTTVYNTNDTAKGMFSYPNPGAMVWVFFREGNPLYPVYFAASYSAKEWSSVYKTSSESGDGMSFGSINNTGITSQKDSFNFGGGNSIFSLNTVDHSDPLASKSVLALQGNDGSNMMITNGQHQLYTRHNRRDQVDRDRFETTMGFKEQWVEGDYSTNVRGNYIIKVGKFDEESMKALQELAKQSAETNAKLTKSS